MFFLALCALLLGLSIVSFWIFQRRVFGFGLYIVGLIVALVGKLITPIGLITLGALLVGFVLVNNPHLPKKVRPVGYLILLAIGIALSLHIAPGFHGWDLLSMCQTSPVSVPFNLCFNFDKVSLGIFILVSGVPLCHSGHEWRKAIHVAAVFTILAAAVLCTVALTLEYVRWDPKLPSFTPLWLITNLLFTAVVEEVIVRSFVQEKISIMTRAFRWHYLISLVGSSLVFALGYYMMGAAHIILAFIAGLFYGGAYIASGRKVEASIVTHFMVNFVHLLGFSYPALGI